MVKRYRETAYHKKKKKTKRLSKAAKRSINASIRLLRSLNTKSNRKKLQSASKAARRIQKNLQRYV